MDRRTFVGAAVALPFAALAQAIQRVSFVSAASAKSWGHLVEELRTELRALGYHSDRNLAFDVWWADDRTARVQGLIAEVLVTKPDVIVTHGSFALASLQKATSAIPIVFATAGDPVGQGFVASYRRPGGNITGVAFNEAVNEKVYELAKTLLPGISRVALLFNPNNPASRHHRRIRASASKSLGLEIVELNADSEQTVQAAFARAATMKLEALFVPAYTPYSGMHALIADLQLKHRLPAFHTLKDGTVAGGFASYSFPMEENFRRAAKIVAQILKGRPPGDIPVEIPNRYELTINMRTARALGIKVPEGALMRAHHVIGT